MTRIELSLQPVMLLRDLTPPLIVRFWLGEVGPGRVLPRLEGIQRRFAC